MKRKVLVLTLISTILLLTVNGLHFVRLTAANPFVFEGKIPPSDSTKPPNIIVTSPLNNTTLDAHDVSLRFNISIPKSPNVSQIKLTHIYLEVDWKQSDISLYHHSWDPWDHGISEFKFSNLNEGLAEGNHSIVIHAEAHGSYRSRTVISSNGSKFFSDHPLGHYVFDTKSTSTVFFTIDRTSPKISILSLENKTYSNSDVALNFTVSESSSRISYTLDGQENVTVVGNTTLAGLTEGGHNITVYATDFAGHTSASETIYFNVELTFPTTLVIAPTASVAVIGAGLTIYFKRRRAKPGGEA